MNRISGRIVVKETGAGIPDLLIAFFDLDPHSRAEEDLNPLVVEPGADRGHGIVGSRLGSVLTNADGSFAFEYDNEAFRSGNEERRPDLTLMVIAPEDPEERANPKILHASHGVRQNAGQNETYFVRLPASLLKDAGIPVPTDDVTALADSETIIGQARDDAARRERIDEGLRQINATRVKDERELTKKVEKKFEGFYEVLSHVPAARRKLNSYVAPGADVEAALTEVMRGDIEKTINVHEFQGRISLNEEEIAALNLTNSDETPVEITASEELNTLLFGKQDDGSRPTVLERLSPIELACRLKAFPADPCIAPEDPTAHDMNGNDSPDIIDTTPTVPNTTPNIALPENGDVAVIPTMDARAYAATKYTSEYIEKLLTGMTAPESPVVMPFSSEPVKDDDLEELSRPGERAKPIDIREEVKSLRLRGGPADETAYYDFHNLQIAFEHVWQEALDASVISGAKNLYRRLVREADDVLSLESSQSPLELCEEMRRKAAEVESAKNADPPAMVVQTFEVTGEQWNVLNAQHRAALEAAAVEVGRRKQQTVMVGNVRHRVVNSHPGGQQYIGDPVSQGKSILRYADSELASDKKSLHELLDALEERIKEPYAFTRYAVDKTGRTVNFGLLVTYRQKWEPLNYQAGKLIKTIPLAPKEVRKYTRKNVVKRSRARKEVENNMQSRKEESSDTSRAEREIVLNAQAKTNFSMTAQGGVKLKVVEASGTTAFSRETATTSNEVKKEFREAILKSAEEYKEEHTVEINTTDSFDTESEESGEISNPNDEIPVTYLFYELQRRYRISEEIHRLMPVVLVAQEVPAPHEIDEDWLVAHDWILRRVILDDSFIPALIYLSTRLVGDEFALKVMSDSLAKQREVLDKLTEEIVLFRAQAGQRYTALERATEDRAVEAAREAGGGLFGITNYLLGGGGGDADERARIREDAAKDAYERAARIEKDQRDRLEREVTALHAATEAYIKTLTEHLNRKAQIARLRVHVKQNILYYMQAIWSYEQSDQRFFRLHKEPVPRLEGTLTYNFTKAPEPVTDPPITVLPDLTPNDNNLLMYTFTAKIDLDLQPQQTNTLAEVADLDNLLGYKGNYMIFPLRQSNALTDFMITPYLDNVTQLRDPDEAGNWTPSSFLEYVCCLKKNLSNTIFDDLLPRLKQKYGEILTVPRRGSDEVIVPTGSLFIEALAGTRPILEDFKLLHRAIDVKKVQAEVRRAELENVRLAARLLMEEREDPDIEKKIVIEGSSTDVDVSVDE